MASRAVEATISLFAMPALLILSSCGKEQKDRDSNQVNIEVAKQEIAADEARWNQQFASRNLDAMVSHFAPDATIVEPGAKALSGTDAIRGSYAGVLKDPNFHVTSTVEKTVVAASGDLAYSRGHFTAHYTDPATKRVRSGSGSFLTVYGKRDDGKWKWLEDFAAADPPQY